MSNSSTAFDNASTNSYGTRQSESNGPSNLSFYNTNYLGSSHLANMSSTTHQKQNSIIHVESRHSARTESMSSSWVRETLRRLSYCSSTISDVLSILHRRFSSSSIGSLGERSVNVASISDKEDGDEDSSSSVQAILDSHQTKKHGINKDIATKCCSRNSDCIHRLVTNLAISMDHVPAEEQPNLLCEIDDVQTLFFIAFSGAPADTILSAVGSSNDLMNEVDADGQNFMFFLDPTRFWNQTCTCNYIWEHRKNSCACCIEGAPHSSKFECLIRMLEQRHFDFEHMDNNGRSFLTYLCAEPGFRFEWLSLEARTYPRLEFAHRLYQFRDSTKHFIMDYLLAHNYVNRLCQLRDSAGHFIIDYLAAHPRFDSFDEVQLSHVRPKLSLFADSHIRVVEDERANGRTVLHDFWATEPMQLNDTTVTWNQQDINRYDLSGKTPLMLFIERSMEAGTDEGTIGSWILWGVRRGANINARSRSGSTILHLAVKESLVRVVALVLSLGARVSLPDNLGLTPLDYAATKFDLSRNKESRAIGDSLKTITKLLDDTGAPVTTSSIPKGPASRGSRYSPPPNAFSHFTSAQSASPISWDRPLVHTPTDSVELNSYFLNPFDFLKRADTGITPSPAFPKETERDGEILFADPALFGWQF